MMQVFLDGKHVGNVQMGAYDFWAGRLASGAGPIPVSVGPFRWKATFKARIKKSDLRFLRRLSGRPHGKRVRRARFYAEQRVLRRLSRLQRVVRECVVEFKGLANTAEVRAEILERISRLPPVK